MKTSRHDSTRNGQVCRKFPYKNPQPRFSFPCPHVGGCHRIESRFGSSLVDRGGGHVALLNRVSWTLLTLPNVLRVGRITFTNTCFLDTCATSECYRVTKDSSVKAFITHSLNTWVPILPARCCTSEAQSRLTTLTLTALNYRYESAWIRVRSS